MNEHSTATNTGNESSEHSLEELVITPTSSSGLLAIFELWRYRDLILTLAIRDIRVRYKQTVLGVAWAVLQPAATVLVLTLFLGRLARVPTGDGPREYELFVFAGILPWQLFASTMNAASASVLGAEGLISKVYFPRIILPVAATASAVVDFCVSYTVMILLMTIYGYRLPWEILLTLPIAGMAYLAALALGTAMAALNVKYRDFRFFTPFIVQLGLFATPTIYLDPTAAMKAGDSSGVSTSMLSAAYINPMTAVIEAFRDALYGLPLPWYPLGISAAVIAVVLFGSFRYFRRVEDGFVDII